MIQINNKSYYNTIMVLLQNTVPILHPLFLYSLYIISSQLLLPHIQYSPSPLPFLAYVTHSLFLQLTFLALLFCLYPSPCHHLPLPVNKTNDMLASTPIQLPSPLECLGYKWHEDVNGFSLLYWSPTYHSFLPPSFLLSYNLLYTSIYWIYRVFINFIIPLPTTYCLFLPFHRTVFFPK